MVAVCLTAGQGFGIHHCEGIVPEENSWDSDLQVRARDQVNHIVSAFAERSVGINVVPAGDGGVDHMHAEGELLVRDEHVPAVHEILNPGVELSPAQVRRVVPGVSLVTSTNDGAHPTVAESLDRIDELVGAGMATPNHVLTVAPAIPCPATEPQEAYYETEPYPSVRTENSGAGIRVYVADTGMLKDAEAGHPWLKGVQRAPNPDGTEQAWDPAGIELDGVTTIPPYAGHGTFVAGVIRCMAPQADVMVSNVFQVAGSVLESDLVAELDRALAWGADVFNLSISTATRLNLSMLSFDNFRRRLQQYKGAVCIVAAGNDGSPVPVYPAAYPEMVSVGALGADWRGRARFSNYGGWVDVYAPGRDLVNAYATGPYECHEYPYKGQIRDFYGMARWSGTSFSTPVVTGLVAARMSRTGETGQEAAAALVAEARANAVPGVGAVLLPPR
jgi:subtilisin family serine protease